MMAKTARGTHTLLAFQVSGRTVHTQMFRKGVVVDHKAKIDIKDGFLTVREFTVNGQAQKKIELMVLDFETVQAGQSNDTGFSALDYNDVPF